MPHIHELYDFTTSAFILHPSEPKLLLLKHKKIGKWLQPGGHIELDEGPLDALTHELQEETGLNPKDYTILEPSDSPKPIGKSATNRVLPLPFYMNEHSWDGKSKHMHIDICYLIKAIRADVTDNPDGASAIKWLTIGEITALNKTGELYDDTLTIAKWIFDNKT